MHACYNNEAVKTRLSRIEGHVRGIKKMIEEDQDCEHILLQLAAVNAAVKKVSRIIFDNHLEGCLTEAIEHGEHEEMMHKLRTVLDRIF